MGKIGIKVAQKMLCTILANKHYNYMKTRNFIPLIKITD